MKTDLITREEFDNYIQTVINYEEMQTNLSDVIRKFNSKIDDFAEFYMPSLAYMVIDLLEKIFKDENDWISYWAYELDFGKKYEDGKILNADGSIIKLQTVDDLWNLLNLED